MHVAAYDIRYSFPQKAHLASFGDEAMGFSASQDLERFVAVMIMRKQV
jgi:hypothetical protein